MSHSQPHYYLRSRKIRETGMEMYGSLHTTATPINQINRCAWDYKFINEAMDLERERERVHFSNCHQQVCLREGLCPCGLTLGTLHRLRRLQ